MIEFEISKQDFTSTIALMNLIGPKNIADKFPDGVIGYAASVEEFELVKELMMEIGVEAKRKK